MMYVYFSFFRPSPQFPVSTSCESRKASLLITMAVAMGAFSIREYAGKMRTLEFGKCWPFVGGGAGRALPPMAVRKFRWWADELEITRKGEENVDSGGIAPEKDGASGEASAPEDEQRGRGKHRAPKKRSIVELFAVAPQIETVEEETDGDGERDAENLDEAGEVEAGGAGKERMKKVIKRKKMKMMSKEKKLKIEICVSKKEKDYSSKVQSSVNISKLQKDSVNMKRIGKALKSPVESMKKKPSMVKSLAKKQGFKLCRTSKLISKNQEGGKGFPVHSILKNKTRGTSIKKSSMKGTATCNDLLRFCCGSAKHVSFSGKDDILGHKKGSPSMELPQLQNLCKIVSDVLTASSAINNSSRTDSSPTERAEMVKTSEKDVVTGAVESSMEPLPESENSTAHGQAVPLNFTNSSNKTCSDMGKCLLAEHVDLNCTIQSLHPGSSTLSSGHSCSGNTAVQISFQDISKSKDASHVENLSECTMSLPKPIKDSVTRADITSSMTMTRNSSPQQSSSCLTVSIEANGRESHSPVDPKVRVYSHVPEFWHGCRRSSKDLMSSICLSAGSKKSGEWIMTPDQSSVCREKHTDNDFIGLPLNSQGEFIHLHPGSKFGFSEISKKQKMLLKSLQGFTSPQVSDPNYNMDHLKLKGKFPDISVCRKDQWIPGMHHSPDQLVISASGFTGLQGSERVQVHQHELVKDKDQFFFRDASTLRASCHGCREHDQAHNRVHWEKSCVDGNSENRFQHSMPPTVRLMGKNVTVGKSSRECEGFDDGKIWTDKEIITERNTLRDCGITHPKGWPEQEWFACPSSRTSKENLRHPQEAPPCFFQMPPLYHRANHMNFDCCPPLMPRAGLGNHSPRMETFSYPFHSQEVLNKTSSSLPNYNCGIESSFKVGHHIPMAASHPQTVCQHMLLGSTHCKHSQSVAYYTAAASHPSFLNQGHGNFAQPTWSCSSANLPQWLLEATQLKKCQNSSCSSYVEPLSFHHPCTIPGSNLLPLPSPFPSNIPLHVYGTNISQTCSSSNPSPLAQPTLISDFAVNKPNAAANNICRNKIKDRNGMKLRSAYFQELDHASRTTKRPADKNDGFMKPVKKPNLQVREDSNAPTDSRTRELFHGYSQANTGASDFHACRNKVVDLSPQVIDTGTGETRSSSGLNSSKSDGLARSGPLKLSAGARHILKPSQNTDQDKSTPIHATIPFASGTSSGKLPVSQMRSSQIYRF